MLSPLTDINRCHLIECIAVGFMADSGMFAMVCGHGISAFPNAILIKTKIRVQGRTRAYVFPRRGTCVSGW